MRLSPGGGRGRLQPADGGEFRGRRAGRMALRPHASAAAPRLDLHPARTCLPPLDEHHRRSGHARRLRGDVRPFRLFDRSGHRQHHGEPSGPEGDGRGDGPARGGARSGGRGRRTSRGTDFRPLRAL